MKRSLSIFQALTSVSIGTTSLAATQGTIAFELSANNPDRLQLALQRPGSRNSMSFDTRDLQGFDRSSLASGARVPVSFTLLRDAGRLDCTGSSVNARATGTCRFAPNAGFAAFMADRGIARPTEQQLLDLTLVGARRGLVQALGEARFGSATPGDVTALTALGATPEYIQGMAAAGYRTARAGDLVPLKALNVSPAYIRSLNAVGYRNVPASDLAAMKALNVTAEFIADLQRRGYRDLPVSRLVQLKAMNIRADGIERPGSRFMPVPPRNPSQPHG